MGIYNNIKGFYDIVDIYEKKYGEQEAFGTFVFTDLDNEEQLEVIKNAKGRHIGVKYKSGVLDGGEIEYSGEIDPDFNWEDFVEKLEKNKI